MRKKLLLLSVLISTLAKIASFGAVNKSLGDSIKFYNGQQFTIIGKFHNERNYVRFPQQYKKTLSPNVWAIGQNSAGISIRFRSNASKMAIRWTVTNNAWLGHMAPTGVKGVDLYAYVNKKWQFVNVGYPDGKVNRQTLFYNGDTIYREYLLNLPLYDGVDSLSIGVNASADISVPKENYLLVKKPVVYYGTSIAQGACATRPGMAFTNILSRKLDRSFINLGFSGSGTMETSVGESMCEVNAALYVIDCNPNTVEEVLYERTLKLVRLLKAKRPTVPVLLVEGYTFEHGYFVKTVQPEVERRCAELRKAYDTLKKSGVKALYYKNGDGLIGEDHEGTVDGIHPTDVGMERFAKNMLPVIQSILKKNHE